MAVICKSVINTDYVRCNVNVKVTFTLRQAMKAQRGSKDIAVLFFFFFQGPVGISSGCTAALGLLYYSSTPSLTLLLDGGGWSTSRPGRFTPGKETRYSLYRRLGGPQRRVRNISPLPGFNPRTVQPEASRYTDNDVTSHL
jgi:hypothetical protein